MHRRNPKIYFIVLKIHLVLFCFCLLVCFILKVLFLLPVFDFPSIVIFCPTLICITCVNVPHLFPPPACSLMWFSLQSDFPAVSHFALFLVFFFHVSPVSSVFFSTDFYSLFLLSHGLVLSPSGCSLCFHLNALKEANIRMRASGNRASFSW